MDPNSDKEDWHLDVPNGAATDEEIDEWYFNENCNFDSLHTQASGSPSDGGADRINDLHSALKTLTSFHVPLSTSLTGDKPVEHIDGAFFEVPARRRKQKPLYFGRCHDKIRTSVSADIETHAPEFSHYDPNAHLIMRHWGYDFEKKPGLNYGKGLKSLPGPFVPKGKRADYYQKTKLGLGYISLFSQDNTRSYPYNDSNY